MIIRKNSWHFKLVKFCDDVYAWQVAQKGTTLCAYFWKVVKSLISVVVCGVALTAFVSTLLWLLVIAPVLVFVVGTTSSAVLGAMHAGVVLWVFFIAGTIITGTVGAIAQYNLVSPIKKKEPGLLVSYIKAKKQKFCPRVEVK